VARQTELRSITPGTLLALSPDMRLGWNDVAHAELPCSCLATLAQGRVRRLDPYVPLEALDGAITRLRAGYSDGWGLKGMHRTRMARLLAGARPFCYR